MESWKYLLLIALCFGVSAYMFLSLFFPPLRWMFRMKRLPARAFGVDEAANQKFATGLGLVLAPVIGLSTLGVGIVTIKEWKSSGKRSADRAVREAEERGKLERRLALAFSEWPVSRVYRNEPRKRHQADDASVGQAEEFVRALAGHARDGLIPEKRQKLAARADMLAIELEPDDPSMATLSLLIDPRRGVLGEFVARRNVLLELSLPAELEGMAKGLADLNIIDLDEQAAEERRERAAEKKRKDERVAALGRYAGKTSQGTPAWEIRQGFDEVRGQGEQAFIERHIGMDVGWEIRVARITSDAEHPEESRLMGYQLGENSRKGFYVSLMVPKEMRPEPEAFGEVWWVRATGKIRSISNGQIEVAAESLEPFVPDL